MTETELLTRIKGGIAKASSLLENLWAALPSDFQHKALDAAQAGVSDLSALAETEVAKLPTDQAAVLDAAIAAIDVKAQEDIQRITNNQAIAKAAILSAKAPTQ